MTKTITRDCRNCGELPIEEFYSNGNGGYQPLCKGCSYEKYAEQRVLRKEVLQERELFKRMAARVEWQPEPTVPVKIDHFPKSQSLGSAVSVVFKTAPKRFRRAWSIQ